MSFIKDAEKTDKIILDSIYSNLIRCFDECRQLVNNPYQNLCGLLFHELMMFYSSLYYANIWGYDMNDSNHMFNTYPYLGYRKHKNTYLKCIKYASNKMKLYYSMMSLTKTAAKKVGVCHPALHHRELLQKLYSNGYVPKFPSKPKIYIENYDQQYKLIDRWMDTVEQELNLPKKREVFLHATKESFRGLLSKKEIAPKYDCLVIGTSGKFMTRIEAANALAHNKPVICVAHGNESGTADHPSWGYDDRSFCTHYLGYGSAGDIKINGGTYLHSLYGIEPHYIESSSEYIRDNYNADSEIENIIEDMDTGKYAYIPTKLMGSNRLGPFLSISDDEYTKWQEKILEIFPNLFYKAHPKQISEVTVGHERVVYKSLEECIHDFDGFITDTVLSTAFANIALTDKPIIYLNIGFGRLTPYAEKMIRQRVIWIDIDMNSMNMEKLKAAIKNESGSNKTYQFTQEFSLSSSANSRIESVVGTLNNISAQGLNGS